MQIVLTCISLIRWRWSMCSRLQAVRKDHFRKVSSQRPSDGPILSSSPLCGTILAAVGRHWSVRPTGALPSYVDLLGHASLPWSCWPRLGCVNRVSCVLRATRLSHISSVSLVSRLGRMAHPACMKCATHHMLLMVLLRLFSVCKDHFQKISSERPCDGPIAISGPLIHVQHPSGNHWPTSISEVD